MKKIHEHKLGYTVYCREAAKNKILFFSSPSTKALQLRLLEAANRALIVILFAIVYVLYALKKLVHFYIMQMNIINLLQ